MPSASNLMPEEERLQAIAAILKEELLCGTEAAKAVAKLRETLQKNPSGKGVTDDVKALETALQKLGALAKRTDAFLAQAGAKRLLDAVQALPPSPLREGVHRLAIRAAQQQRALQTAVATADSLLEKSRGFIEFHVNLMTQTAASDTYTPPGASEAELRRGRRMFDANV